MIAVTKIQSVDATTTSSVFYPYSSFFPGCWVLCVHSQPATLYDAIRVNWTLIFLSPFTFYPFNTNARLGR